ncbi:hypothetical protein [Azospirillum argentinense]
MRMRRGSNTSNPEGRKPDLSFPFPSHFPAGGAWEVCGGRGGRLRPLSRARRPGATPCPAFHWPHRRARSGHRSWSYRSAPSVRPPPPTDSPPPPACRWRERLWAWLFWAWLWVSRGPASPRSVSNAVSARHPTRRFPSPRFAARRESRRRSRLRPGPSARHAVRRGGHPVPRCRGRGGEHARPDPGLAFRSWGCLLLVMAGCQAGRGRGPACPSQRRRAAVVSGHRKQKAD